MKKLLLYMLISISVYGYGQDREITDGAFKTETAITDEVFGFATTVSDTTIWRMRAEHAFPFIFSSSAIKPRLTTYNLRLGQASVSLAEANFKFLVNGTSIFKNNLHISSGALKFGLQGDIPYIRATSSDIEFYSPISGVVTLSDLESNASTYTFSNGIEYSSGKYMIGGDLVRNTVLDLNNHSLEIGDGVLDQMTLVKGRFSVYNTGVLELQAPLVSITAQNRFSIYNSSSTNWFQDLNTTPYGLQCYEWESVWDNIQGDTIDGAYMTYGAVKELIDSIEISGGGIGGTLDSTEVADSPVKYIQVWDSTVTYYDTWELEEEDSESELKCATIPITSANITDGDSLQVVAAPGSLKSIIPVKIAIYYDYNTAAYTSTGGDNSALIKNDNTYSDFAITDDVIENGSDLLALYRDGSTSYISRLSYAQANNINMSYWIDFYPHTGATATGTAILKFWYYIADFN